MQAVSGRIKPRRSRSVGRLTQKAAILVFAGCAVFFLLGLENIGYGKQPAGAPNILLILADDK